MLKAYCKSILLGLLTLPLMATGGAKPKSKAPGHSVNLNSATVTELMQLPKVGARTAERIVSWRKEHGGFRRPEEVMHVKGIGEKGYLRLKPYLQVGASTGPTPKPVAIHASKTPAQVAVAKR